MASDHVIEQVSNLEPGAILQGVQRESAAGAHSARYRPMSSHGSFFCSLSKPALLHRDVKAGTNFRPSSELTRLNSRSRCFSRLLTSLLRPYHINLNGSSYCALSSFFGSNVATLNIINVWNHETRTEAMRDANLLFPKARDAEL